MKTKYWALAILAAVGGAICYFRFRNNKEEGGVNGSFRSQTAAGEKHLRNVLKKSKLVG